MNLELPKLHFATVWWFIGGLMLGTVVVLSLLPGESMPAVTIDDKIQHFVTYGGLMGFFANLRFSWRFRVLTASCLVLLGVGLEFGQMLTGRTFDLADMRANTMGVMLGWALCYTPLGRVVQWLDNGLENLGKDNDRA
jgi:VanZ family protein